jgi:hypothetical protein
VRWALVAGLFALLIPAVAAAHVTIAPPFVDDGVESTISFQTPNERPPHATISLSVRAPPGVSIVSASGAPAGWHATISGSQVTWTGGRLTGRTTTNFPLQITPKVRAGTVSFTAAQRYDDKGTVRWKTDLSVLPASGAAAPKQHPWTAVIAAIVGALVIGGSLVAVRYLRRKPLPDR